ncbi:peptide-methionine (S)-S-oxide reductase MsrA [Paenibacillus sp. GCM10012306]|uniref:peptide-methionine (S)-S-oxide reductase MsrA n=1 Tax=Paenibacillus sp. GCM10012306 TaxID=3317342 RepID=UPI00361410B1
MTFSNDEIRTIVVAGGCFWGVEEYYRRLKGIIDTEVGFGHEDESIDTNNYDDLIESVKLTYDSNLISLDNIIDHLFRIIDPTSYNKQGPDEGPHYRTGIFYENLSDKIMIDNAITSKSALYTQPIHTKARNLHHFQIAEAKHQEYLANNPNAQCHVDFSLIKDDEKK